MAKKNKSREKKSSIIFIVSISCDPTEKSHFFTMIISEKVYQRAIVEEKSKSKRGVFQYKHLAKKPRLHVF